MLTLDPNKARANVIVQALTEYYVAAGSTEAAAVTAAQTHLTTATQTQKQNANPNTNIGNLRIRGLTTTL